MNTQEGCEREIRDLNREIYDLKHRTCVTCKHWTGFEKFDSSVGHMVRCEKPELNPKTKVLEGVCTRIYPPQMEDQTNYAYITVSDDYGLEFVCGSDFGCVLHESKL